MVVWAESTGGGADRGNLWPVPDHWKGHQDYDQDQDDDQDQDWDGDHKRNKDHIMAFGRPLQGTVGLGQAKNQAKPTDAKKTYQ